MRDGGLRTRILRGGAFLAVRQGLSMAIVLGGGLLLTTLIGPRNYGTFAAAMGLFAFVQGLCAWGIDVFLLRREGEVPRAVYHQAFTLLCLSALLGMGALGLCLPLVESWLRLEGVEPLLLALALALPFTLLHKVPQATLERELDYKRLAMIDLGCQVAAYATAIPLALAGWGSWAPLAGWWVQVLGTFLLVFRIAPYRPSLHWDSALIMPMLGYGLGFSASTWVWQLRTLVNPLVVGRFAGLEAVGYVALAIRFVEALSFVKHATWHLSLAALGRLQAEPARLAQAVGEGMRLQVLALGPFLVGFAWVAPGLLPLVFGPSWAPVAVIFPFVALAYLANALFNMHSSALYTLRKNREVTVFHGVHIALFAGAAWLLVPRMGWSGYGWAELAALASYLVIHQAFATTVGQPRYAAALLWSVGFGLAVFAHQSHGWSALGLLLVLLSPASWKEVRGLVGHLRRSRAPLPTGSAG